MVVMRSFLPMMILAWARAKTARPAVRSVVGVAGEVSLKERALPPSSVARAAREGWAVVAEVVAERKEALVTHLAAAEAGAGLVAAVAAVVQHLAAVANSAALEAEANLVGAAGVRPRPGGWAGLGDWEGEEEGVTPTTMVAEVKAISLVGLARPPT